MAQRKTSPRKRRAGRQNTLGFVILGFAIVCAAYFISSNRPVQATAPVVNVAPVVGQFDTVSVPVPSEPVTAGTKMREISFRQVSFPSHQVPKGAITNLTPYLEGVAIAALPANLPLFPENISLASDLSNPVIERIPPGMRAMTVRVDATTSVEGWAGTGSLVDVLLVDKNETRVIAEKVQILSAERSVNPVQAISGPSVPSTVTLLVTQEQCLAINTAIPQGKIAFALRSMKDEGKWGSRHLSSEALREGDDTLRYERVDGYVEFSDEPGQRFALSNGTWTKTNVVPEGFDRLVQPEAGAAK
ncbi:MAG: Flp pilus assembly protein CpaB [Bdellovibrionales bacterium]|nr:Flp pilus assembly protein CpaB [Bdellovibrionales bacterium]